MVRRPFINMDITGYFDDTPGANKSIIVIHETVSHDHSGLSDIKSIASYLGSKGLGIHLIVDQEGKSGYSFDEGAIYAHARGNNTDTIGIELISFIPALRLTPWKRFRIWLSRERQLHKAARWCAYYSDRHGFPLRYSGGKVPGITSHYDISIVNNVSGGHWDAKPKHKGGHCPIKRLVKLAKLYKSGKLAYAPIRSFKMGKST